MMIEPTPLRERLERFIAAFPNARHLPVHPVDLDEAKILAPTLTNLEVVELGKIRLDDAELVDVDLSDLGEE